jgi:4-amino-4-deoxy-L-arabinose transferase-like glycosyltransferase
LKLPGKPDSPELLLEVPVPMSIPRSVLHLAIVMGFWVAIYATSLSSPVLLDDTDTVHAEAVREMVQSGDWVTLKINNGFRYLEKAPLMYWMSALCVSCLGLSEATVRFPVALAHLALAVLIWRMGKRFWSERVGFYAALMYITSLGPYAFTRIFHPDVILTFFIAFALYCYLQVYFDEVPAPRQIWPLDWRCMGVYASAALAVLTKGLIGVIFVGMVVLGHLLLSGSWRVLKRLQIVPGVVVFLLVAAPWHLAAGFSNKGFFWFYFVNEHFLRYLGLRYPNDWAAMPVWLFWILLLVWFFPWTAFGWGLVRTFPRSLRPPSPLAQVNLFLYGWALLILIFFSFSTTQEYYTFPALPAIALLLGQVLAWLESPQGATEQRKGVIGVAVFASVCVILAGGLLGLAWLGKASAGARELSDTIVANPDRYLITFGRMQEFTPATFGQLSTIIYQTAAVLVIGPLAALLASFRKRWNVVAFFLALMMVGVLYSYRSAMLSFEPILTSKDLARVIKHHYQPNDRIVVNGIYEKGSSLNFYSGHQVSVLNGFFGNLWYGSYFPDAPPIFYDDPSFLKLWASRQRVFFFSDAGDLKPFLEKHPDFSYRELAESGGKKLLVNWPQGDGLE